MANKSGIHIKPANVGKFTAYKKRTGKTTEEALHSKDPHVRQMANFARNAKKWKHEDGGYVDQYGLGGFLKGNLGTIGSIAGGALGSIIAPGIGTSIGASLGGSLGGVADKSSAQSDQNAAVQTQNKTNMINAANQQFMQNRQQTVNQPTFAYGGISLYPTGGTIDESKVVTPTSTTLTPELKPMSNTTVTGTTKVIPNSADKLVGVGYGSKELQGAKEGEYGRDISGVINAYMQGRMNQSAYTNKAYTPYMQQFHDIKVPIGTDPTSQYIYYKQALPKEVADNAELFSALHGRGFNVTPDSIAAKLKQSEDSESWSNPTHNFTEAELANIRANNPDAKFATGGTTWYDSKGFYDPIHPMYARYACGGNIMATGGNVQPNAELEKGEPYRTPDGNIGMIPTSAPSHAEGGVQMNLPQGTQILGKMQNPEFEKEYKELGSQLKKAQDKYNKVLESRPTMIAKKTAKMMLDKVQNKYDQLMQSQEAQKGNEQQQQFAMGGTALMYNGRMTGDNYFADGGTTSNNFDWDNTLSTVANYAPIAYNIGQGLFGKTETVQPSYNPYEGQVSSLMSNRSYNIDPELEANRSTQSAYNQALRQGAPSQSQYLAALNQGQINKMRSDADAYSKKQNVENQYKSEEAQMLEGLGRQRAAAKASSDELNAQTRASKRNMLSTGLSQLQQASQVRKQSKGQETADKQRMQILKDLYGNYPFKVPGLN